MAGGSSCRPRREGHGISRHRQSCGRGTSSREGLIINSDHRKAASPSQGSAGRPPLTAPDISFTLVTPEPPVARSESLCLILVPVAPALILTASGKSITAFGHLWQRGPQSLSPASGPAPASGGRLPPGFSQIESSLGLLLLL